MTSEKSDSHEPDLIRALGHPLRAKVLEALGQREASPKELSKLFDAPLGLVSYHTRVLIDCECIELTRTEPRRGVAEHYYRAVPELSKEDQIWLDPPRSLRRHATFSSLKAFARELVAALMAGEMASDDRSPLKSMRIELDEAGRAEAIEIVREAISRLNLLGEECQQRGMDTDALLTPHIAGLAFFPASPQTSPRGS